MKKYIGNFDEFLKENYSINEDFSSSVESILKTSNEKLFVHSFRTYKGDLLKMAKVNTDSKNTYCLVVISDKEIEPDNVDVLLNYKSTYPILISYPNDVKIVNNINKIDANREVYVGYDALLIHPVGSKTINTIKFGVTNWDDFSKGYKNIVDMIGYLRTIKNISTPV